MRNLKALGEALRWKLEPSKDRFPYRPVGADIQRDFEVNDQQLKTIKQHAKNFAAQQGKVLGYDPDPDFHCWRVVDHTEREAVFRILMYGSANWRDAGKSYLYQAEGAYNAGVLAEATLIAIRELVEEFDKRIELLEKGMSQRT